MKFNERLKKARTDKGLSQKAVMEFFIKKGYDIKAYQISKWESGSRKPGIEEFTILCECLNINDLRLLTGKRAFPKDETALDGLNGKGKAHVLNYIKMLKADATFTEDRPIIKSRAFRLYDIPVSAGAGEYLDEGGYEEITADDLIPDGADFAVRVSGDSMEPKYYDGQILFIRKQETLDEGEIGIFALNGESFVKKLEKNTLVSLNPKYKPIKIQDSDALRIYGKVIGAN